MRLQGFRLLVAALIVFGCAGLSVLVAGRSSTPEAKFFDIQARQYAYDPPVINVNRGDTVHIRLSALDVIHGFYLEGHDIDAEIYPLKPLVRLRDPSQKSGFRDVEEILFRAIKVGKFRYRCSHTCGYLHPFMQGEFIVGPNYPYHAAIGGAIGILVAGGFLFLAHVRSLTKCKRRPLIPEPAPSGQQDSQQLDSKEEDAL